MGTESAIDVLKGNLKISGADLVEKVQVRYEPKYDQKTPRCKGNGQVMDCCRASFDSVSAQRHGQLISHRELARCSTESQTASSPTPRSQ